MKANINVYVALLCVIFLVVSGTAAAGRAQPVVAAVEIKDEEAKDAKVGKDYNNGGGYTGGGGTGEEAKANDVKFDRPPCCQCCRACCE